MSTQILERQNQQKLTAAIREKYKGEFVDWYDLACYLKRFGHNNKNICERFALLGVEIADSTLSVWISTRRRREQRRRMMIQNDIS